MDKIEMNIAALTTAGLYQNPSPTGTQPPPPPYPLNVSQSAHLDQKLQSIISRTQDGFLDLERVITTVKGVGSFRSTQPGCALSS